MILNSFLLECCNSIVWNLLQPYESFIIFRSSETLYVPVTTGGISTIITILDISIYMRTVEIILIISLSEMLEKFRASCITYCFQYHIVSLLQCNEINILLGLIKRYNSSKSLLCFFLLMHSQRVLVVNIVTAPEVEA